MREGLARDPRPVTPVASVKVVPAVDPISNHCPSQPCVERKTR